MSTSQSVGKITTVEELDALPVGSVIRCTEDPDNTGLRVAEKRSSGWMFAGESRRNTSFAMASDSLPATVLFRPDAPAPSAEDFDVQQSDDGITRADEDRESLAGNLDALVDALLRGGQNDAHRSQVALAGLGYLRDAARALAARQPAPVVSAEQVRYAAEVMGEARWPEGAWTGGTSEPPEADDETVLRVALDTLGIEVPRG